MATSPDQFRAVMDQLAGVYHDLEEMAEHFNAIVRFHGICRCPGCPRCDDAAGHQTDLDLALWNLRRACLDLDQLTTEANQGW